MNNQKFYDDVAVEIKNRNIKAGLWARAVAEVGDEGGEARAHYIQLRVTELEHEERLKLMGSKKRFIYPAMNNKIFALAGVVIRELYRRKDFYVLFVLTALLTLAAGAVNFFHDDKIVRYVKDVCLLLIWVSALVISVVTTARQIPAEREARTIFPLLAKPVSRGQVIVGKFLGCWLATGVALVVFYFFFAAVTGSKEQVWPWTAYLEAVWMHWAMLAIVIAMVLLGSIYFAAPSSTSTITLIVVGGILLLGTHLNTIALQQPEPMQSILATLYFVMPHLEWYDLRDFVIYDMGLVPVRAVALATLYAAVWTGILLLLAWFGFRRKNLTT